MDEKRALFDEDDYYFYAVLFGDVFAQLDHSNDLKRHGAEMLLFRVTPDLCSLGRKLVDILPLFFGFSCVFFSLLMCVLFQSTLIPCLRQCWDRITSPTLRM